MFGLTGCLDDSGISSDDILDLLTGSNGDSDGDSHGDGDEVDKCRAIEEELRVCYEVNRDNPEICIRLEEELVRCRESEGAEGTFLI